MNHVKGVLVMQRNKSETLAESRFDKIEDDLFKIKVLLAVLGGSGSGDSMLDSPFGRLRRLWVSR